MPARKLSSDIQGLLAMFVVGICVVAAGLVIAFAVQTPSWQNLRVVPTLVLIGALALTFARLKRVVGFDDELEVSDFVRVQFIPYQNISRIRVYNSRNVAYVALKLRAPARFGPKVRFLTNMHLAYAQDQPDVVWLVQRCGFTPQPRSAWWKLLAPFFGFRDYA